MNIVVCIKQVPDTGDIRWTKENNLDRANMLSKLNEQDEWALDYAVKIKNKFKDVRITALSMGPNQAKEALEYALAKGADSAILLSDKLFSGSDTYATAKILACAISKYLGDFDLILTGQMASDGDTAQTPVSLAQMLDIIDATKRIAGEVKSGKIAPEAIDAALFATHLSTNGTPDPDLVIRTSGEERISNFLLWELAYAELYFTPVYWPDFDEKAFDAALDAYAKRQRRFGRVL